ncbi:MAG: ABC transporter substrate-binding protein [Micromonosporaceae bacterium]
MSSFDRRDFLRLTGTAAATSVLATACTGPATSGGKTSTGKPVKIGLLLPESGVYKALGDDQRNGWNLFLKLNGGKLGGRDVDVVTADEGDGLGDTAITSTEHLIDEEVVVACGVISSGNLVRIQEMWTKAKIPFVSTNASPSQVQGQEYGWRTSFVNNHAAVAIGSYVAKTVDGPVGMIIADYAAGHDYLKGFQTSFAAAGGEYAGEPVMTKFPIANKSFEPYLRELESNDPAAVYAFYAGADAVKFVKEYEKYGLADKYQLYAPGYLTEGGALTKQGAAAEGILNSQNYAPDLDNPPNRQLVAEYQKEYGVPPTCYAVAAWDACWVLDRAIKAAGDDLTSESLETQIGNVGQIDSPRGPWQFGKNRSPVQTWYLREAKKDGDVLANVVIDELGTLGDEE